MAASDSLVDAAPASSHETSTKGLVSIGKLSQITGLHISTIRRLDSHLPSFVLPSGHRRYRAQEVLAFLRKNGLISQEEKAENDARCESGFIPICLVTRVSTPKEQQKTSIVNQKERLLAYVEQEFGKVKTRLYFNERIASGLNLSHPKIIELIDLILGGKLNNGFILCCFKCRLCRYGHAIFERLCELNNITIKYIDSLDTKTEAQELQEDIINILTSFTARANGMKVKKLYGVKLTEEVTQTILELRQQRVGPKSIAKELAKRSLHLDINGRELTWNVIHKFLAKNGKIVRRLNSLNEPSPAQTNGDSLARFLGSKVKLEGKSRFKAFYASYRAFCEGNSLIPLHQQRVSTDLRLRGVKMKLNDGYLVVFATVLP